MAERSQKASLPSPGDVLAGKYKVVRLLGQGGMGAVFECEHSFLAQRVAVKLLLAGGVPEAAARFLNEARAAARLRSDHVVRVSDFGVLDDRTPYLVMELLEGTDLAGVLASRGPLSVSEAADTILEALEALSQAHLVGIVHRDLKPANVFIAQRPGVLAQVKLLDFGISKSIDPIRDTPSYTASLAVLGSPHYMSPEQIAKPKSADARSDLWSVGVLLYELLTKKLPFEGESLGALFSAVRETLPAPVRSLRPDLPAELERVIQRCLEKDPARRFGTAAELAEALAPFATERGARALQQIHTHAAVSGPTLSAGETSQASGATPSTLGAVSRDGTPRRVVAVRLALVAGVGAVTAIVAVGAHALHGSGPSAPVDAAPALASGGSTEPSIDSGASATPMPPATGVGGVDAPAESSSPDGATSPPPPRPKHVPSRSDPGYDPFSAPRR